MTAFTRIALLVPLVLAACEAGPEQVVVAIQADRFAGSEWSDPVNLGPVVNSSAVDANASLSPDAHELYFVSTRVGGFGLQDLWMSRRQCLSCPWEAPVNLGATINTSTGDASPTLSENGKLLFFFSGRPGGFGGADIYVSPRLSTGAAGAVWGAPVNLGADVNTAGTENGPVYVKISGEGDPSLYFNRVGPTGNTDIYRVFLSNDGLPLGPAELIAEFSDPAGADQKVAFSTDGHELFLSAIRSAGFGGFDIYRYTRQSASHPWSAPEHLEAPINTPDLDAQPNLSRDGRTMIFTSIRAGGSGMQDLWMSTRAPGGN